jgi:hypothetical protein
MDDTLAFQTPLADALDKRREWLDRSQDASSEGRIPNAAVAFTGLHNVSSKRASSTKTRTRMKPKSGSSRFPLKAPSSESEKSTR